MRTFAGIPESLSGFDKASILLQSIPYDGTSTWGKGADRGFDAFLEAAENMELYDIETDSEPYRKGVHLLPPILVRNSPEAVFSAVYKSSKELLTKNKFLTFLGGEHSVSIGIIKAFYEHHDDLTVLQIDAHADLRKEYLGSRYNHACALYDASRNCNLIQAGIRSMDISEKNALNLEKCYFMHQMIENNSWINDSISKMTDKVYITLDLDALDPAIMPATGTPEPGGFGWYGLIEYLKAVFSQRTVVGFDIVELSPIEGFSAPEFLVAKLYYKMLAYKFYYGR